MTPDPFSAPGRPYFVMELVRGIPLTEFCDQNRLTTYQRLELVWTICQAVQHAHQKGIIHRDLKPTNILVTLHDGVPVPKIIDFGVAKALHQQLTEKTLFTAFGQMVGTPQYMSPEQAEMSGLDIDTRSDIYSLGVVLYELLTGTTPLDIPRLRSAGFAEMQRLIREEEPPKPSTRMSSAGGAATSVAQHRSVDSRRLSRELRGELDWIVMKALEKDRNRRYASAAGLAEDIQRWLRDEPVLACPPSAVYRFQKFARRNKLLLATTGAIAAILLAGAALSTLTATRAVRAEELARQRLAGEIEARQLAERALADEEWQRRLAEEKRNSADTARRRAAAESDRAQQAERHAQANFAQARTAVDQFLTTVSESHLLTIPGMQPLRQAMLDRALGFYERFVAERPDDPQLRVGLAAAYARRGQIEADLQRREQAQEYFARAQQIYEALFQQGEMPSVELGLAEVYYHQRRFEPAMTLCYRSLRRDPGNQTAGQLLADVYQELAAGDQVSREQRLRFHRDGFALRSRLAAADNPLHFLGLGTTVTETARMLEDRGRARDALAQYQRGLEFGELAFAAARYSVPCGQFLASGRSNEADALHRLGQADAAVAARRRAAEVWTQLARENPALPNLRTEVVAAYRELAMAQERVGQRTEAAQTLLLSRQAIGNLPLDTAEDFHYLATVYAAAARDAAPGGNIAAAGPAAEDLREALRALALAAMLGSRGRATIEQAPVFGVLKGRSEFQTLLELLELAELLDQIEPPPKPSFRTKKPPSVPELRDQLAALSGSEKMGLVPSGNGENLGKSAVAKAPVPIFSQPLSGEPLLAQLEASLWSKTGSYFLRGGRWDLARVDFQTALDRLDHAGNVDSTVHAIAAVPLAVETARAWQMLGRSDYFAQRYADAGSAWRSAREALEQGRPVRPDDPRWSEASAALHYELGDGYRMLTAFDGARNSYQQAFAAQPPDSPMQALQLAAVFAQAGDSADYRRLIQWMQESYGGGQPNDVVCTVIAACLLPETDSSNRDLVVRATQAYEAQKTGIRSAHLFAMGLAYLRCGDGAMALDAFSKVKEFTTFAEQPPHLLSLPYYRSLAYHATGDVNRAREELFRAEASYRRAVTGEVLFGNYPTVVHLRDRMRLQVDAVRYAIDVRIAQLARAEASALLDEQSRPDASKHLLAARGFALLGDAARAEAEFGLAEQAAGDDSEMWLACGRLRASLGDHQAADRSFQKAIELDPSNAMHWIHRGRWKAERGLHEQADADFTRGASLTPAELNKFLEAGWWVVGPYAGEPAAACPPEDNPDPSVPVPVMDLRAVRSDAPVAWRPISPDRSGRLYPFHDSQNERASVYLLTYVYSVDQRTVTLRTRRTSEMTIWLNGVSCPTIQVFRDETSVRETADPTALAAWALGHNLTFTPLTLKQGRNTILLKLTHTSPIAAFHFCLNDHPVERAFDLARAGLLDEASEVFAKGYFRESVHDWQYLLRTFFLGGRHHPETLRQAIDDSLTARTNFGMHLAMQTPVCPVDPDELIRYAQTKEFISGIPRWMFRRNVGLGYLRAARWEDAIAVIAKSRSADEFAPIVLAMAHHHLDQGDKARELLAESLVEFQAMLNVETDANPYYVSGNVSRFYTLLREAHVLIAGDAVAVDRQFEQFQSTRRTLWRNRDPATDVFDDLVHIAPDQPEAYIARGRRLVELQRNEEAEADFQRAKDLESAVDRSGL